MRTTRHTGRGEIVTLPPRQFETWLDYTGGGADAVDIRWCIPSDVYVSKTWTIQDVEARDNGWITKALPRLHKIAALPPNWDGEGSPGTDPEIAQAAEGLLSRLGDDLGAVPVPFVCGVPGGGLQFEWDSADKHLELELSDTATIVFLTEEQEPQGERMESGEYPLGNVERTRQLLDWFAAV